MIHHSLDQIVSSSSDENILKDFKAVEFQIYERLPKELPSTGFLKDFSNSMILFIEGKK